MDKLASKLVVRAKDAKVMGREPILYEREMTVRFSDLDPYNHVNASLYLDYIATARLRFLEEKLGVSVKDITDRGFGFYLKKVTQVFKRPVVGLVDVRCVSFVESIDGSTLTIPYSLEDKSGRAYSEGTLEYAIVDLKTGATSSAPDWLIDVFLR